MILDWVGDLVRTQPRYYGKTFAWTWISGEGAAPELSLTGKLIRVTLSNETRIVT